MEFADKIKAFSKRVEGIVSKIQTEEATKTSVIMPFFQILGYDVFNPAEFVPEFTADVGIKKGEKVDYAIVINEKPSILIEAKSIDDTLTKHDSQLFRYFGTTDVKFAILTNGRYYRFYTDLDQPNKMDEKPFLEVDLFNIKEAQFIELKKFSRENFDENAIFNTASDLRYSTEFKTIFKELLNEPDDELVGYFLTKTYEGVKTQNVIDKYRDVLKRALNSYISELMNTRITAALETETVAAEIVEETIEVDDGIETTEQEIQGYYIIKSILAELANPNDIVYKDTKGYLAINYTNNVRKNICRLICRDEYVVLLVPDENKDYKRFDLTCVEDLYQYRTQLIASLKIHLTVNAEIDNAQNSSHFK